MQRVWSTQPARQKQQPCSSRRALLQAAVHGLVQVLLRGAA
jgi:hypothetical protein